HVSALRALLAIPELAALHGRLGARASAAGSDPRLATRPHAARMGVLGRPLAVGEADEGDVAVRGASLCGRVRDSARLRSLLALPAPLAPRGAAAHAPAAPRFRHLPARRDP